MVGENGVREGGRTETSLTCAHFVGLLSPRRPDATRRIVRRVAAHSYSPVRQSGLLSSSRPPVVVSISARDRVARGQSAVSSRRIVDQRRRDGDRASSAPDRQSFASPCLSKKDNRLATVFSLSALHAHAAGSLCCL